MDILISIVLLIIGLALVIKGADYLVDGASSLAFKLGVPALVIGLTIVSFGTSAPELVVSVISALKGSTQASFGNVIGSNLFNTLVILGITAFFAPLKVQSSTVWKEIPFSLLAGLSLLLLGFGVVINDGSLFSIPWSGIQIIGSLGMSEGIVLLTFFAIFMYYTFGLVQAGEQGEINEDEVPQDLPQWKVWVYVVGGLIALVGGGQLAVDNAVQIATAMGISEKIIGLTILSVGTSLPELVTSIKAVRKGQSDIAIGNVIGSNIFNVFWILGIVSLVRPVDLNGSNIFDLMILIAVTVIVFVLLFVNRKFHIEKFEGAVLILAYCGYIGYLLFT